MMEFLQNLVDGSNFPLLTAFLLGLMTAISPCPLATNITATAYLSKDIADKRRVLLNGFLYSWQDVFLYGSWNYLLFRSKSVSDSKVSSKYRWILAGDSISYSRNLNARCNKIQV